MFLKSNIIYLLFLSSVSCHLCAQSLQFPLSIQLSIFCFFFKNCNKVISILTNKLTSFKKSFSTLLPYNNFVMSKLSTYFNCLLFFLCKSNCMKQRIICISIFIKLVFMYYDKLIIISRLHLVQVDLQNCREHLGFGFD